MPTLVFLQLLPEFSAGSGIHVCSLGTKVYINWQPGFSAIHQIVWTEPTAVLLVQVYACTSIGTTSVLLDFLFGGKVLSICN